MSECIDHGQKGSTCRGKVAGYGRANFQGKVTGCHRKAYCLANNVDLKDIEGLVVRHTCNNPRCINPEHLLLGTASDNMQDREEGAYSMKGEGNPSVKISAEDAHMIRELYRLLKWRQVDLGRMFGIKQAQVSRIILGGSW